MNRESVYFSHDADAAQDPKCSLLIYEMGNEGYGCFWRLVELLRVQTDFMYPMKMIPVIAKTFDISEAKLNTIIKAYGLFETTDNGMFFFSQSLRERMALMNEITAKKRLGGIKSGETRRAKALIQSQFVQTPVGVQSESDFDPIDSQRKEKKLLKENRVKENLDGFTSPSVLSNEEYLNTLQTELEDSSNTSRTEPNKEKKGKEILKENGLKEKRTMFAPPTLEEIEHYCRERKNQVDTSRFFDFYEAKGWMVGKNKMKDWKAAVRTWEREDNQKQIRHEETSNRYEQL